MEREFVGPLALARPSARATADDTPAPMPLLVVCRTSMIHGNASEAPASASVPILPRKKTIKDDHGNKRDQVGSSAAASRTASRKWALPAAFLFGFGNRHHLARLAARTKMLLEAPFSRRCCGWRRRTFIKPDRVVAVIIFDGFFLGRIGTDALAGFTGVSMDHAGSAKTTAAWAPAVSSAVRRALGAGSARGPTKLAFHAFLWLSRLPLFFGSDAAAAPYIFGWMGGRDKMLVDALS